MFQMEKIGRSNMTSVTIPLNRLPEYKCALPSLNTEQESNLMLILEIMERCLYEILQREWLNISAFMGT